MGPWACPVRTWLTDVCSKTVFGVGVSEARRGGHLLGSDILNGLWRTSLKPLHPLVLSCAERRLRSSVY